MFKKLIWIFKGGNPLYFFLILSTVSVFALFNTEYIIIQPQAENNLYGGMWYHNHTAASLTLIDGVYQQLFMTNATHMHGFSGGYGYEVPSNLTAEYNGSYNINYYSVGSGQNNHVYRLTVFINEIIKDNCETHYKMATGGDEITMSGNCLLDINAGENISLRIADFTSTGEGIYIAPKETAPTNWEKVNDPVFKDLRLEPELAKLINNLISANKISQVPGLNALRLVNNVLRSIKFIGSAFHFGCCLKTICS